MSIKYYLRHSVTIAAVKSNLHATSYQTCGTIFQNVYTHVH